MQWKKILTATLRCTFVATPHECTVEGREPPRHHTFHIRHVVCFCALGLLALSPAARSDRPKPNPVQESPRASWTGLSRHTRASSRWRAL